jgi:hypothetical protein
MADVFHLEIPVEHLRLDLQERAPPSAYRVVDEHARGAVSFADFDNGVRDLALAGNIADHGVGIGKFLLQRADAFRRTGQRNDAKSFAREASDDRGAGAGTDPGNYGNGFFSHRGLAGSCRDSVARRTLLAAGRY